MEQICDCCRCRTSLWRHRRQVFLSVPLFFGQVARKGRPASAASLDDRPLRCRDSSAGASPPASWWNTTQGERDDGPSDRGALGLGARHGDGWPGLRSAAGHRHLSTVTCRRAGQWSSGSNAAHSGNRRGDGKSPNSQETGSDARSAPRQ
jgi:hypothetical protein